MHNKITKFLTLGGIVWLSAQYLEGIEVVDYTHAVLAALVLAVVNSLIRPILAILTFPITLVTFGFFSFALTAFMVEIMDYFVNGIKVYSFWWALLLGIIISSANSLVDRVQTKPKKVARNKREEFTAYEEVD
ncbi:MAG: phage holin family protein [Bacteroidia bacterium]|nr:phage holin family protein [Bacteroidia bacterium]